jgi:hypothetical protein
MRPAATALLALLSAAALALAGAGGEGSGSDSAAGGRTFVHPGALESRAQLDFVKAKIAAGREQPWTDWFARAAASGHAARTPHWPLEDGTPLVTLHANNWPCGDASLHPPVACTFGPKHDQPPPMYFEAGEAGDDATGAYLQALLWWYTDDDAYAQRALAILNSWAGLVNITAADDQKVLTAGWLGAQIAPAAEIMREYGKTPRGSGGGWAPAGADLAAFQRMLRRAFVAPLSTASTWNGNVDLTQISALVSVSVFLEDDALFQAALRRFNARAPAYFWLATDASPPPTLGGGAADWYWSNPVEPWVNGLCQETCRDNGHHSQFGLGSALQVCEVAYHQGEQLLYLKHQTRLTAAMELLALQLQTGSMQGACKDNKTDVEVYDTFEIGYSHYHYVSGVHLPHTKAWIEGSVRSLARTDGTWNLAWETLTHAGLQLPPPPSSPPPPPPAGDGTEGDTSYLAVVLVIAVGCGTCQFCRALCRRRTVDRKVSDFMDAYQADDSGSDAKSELSKPLAASDFQAAAIH